MAKRLSAAPAEAIIWSAAVTSMKMEAEGPLVSNKSDIERYLNQKYADKV